MTVLVIGGRGRSGRALVSALLKEKVRVRILTRFPNDPFVIYLASIGVDVICGELPLGDVAFKSLMQDVRRVYLISSHGQGVSEEIKMSNGFISSLRPEMIDHLVFQSVLFSKTNLPHCQSKGEIEECLQASGLPFSILSPGIFADALFPDLESIIGQRTDFLTYPVPGNPKLPWTDLRHMGQVGASLLLSDSVGATVEARCADYASFEDVSGMLSGMLGRKIGLQRKVVLNRDLLAQMFMGDLSCTSGRFVEKNLDAEYYQPMLEWKPSPETVPAERYVPETPSVSRVLQLAVENFRSQYPVQRS
jgi:uncharacterized protein YbjT (DUF2867 family)